ncbi:MAG: MFS transporter [Acetobacter sp.]|nr:MFS transporter [Acetobacter sp.]
MTTPQSSSLIGHPGLFSFISARALSAFAIQILGVAVGWQIYAITHSAASLGFVGLAQFLPMLICVFHAGYAADRYNRKYIVLCCEIFEALTASAMAYASFIKALTPTEIYILVGILGLCRAFERPAQQTFLPSLVPSAVFPRAAALSSSVFQFACVAGPSAGGLLYGLGAGVCYSLCAIGFLLAFFSTALIQLEPQTRLSLSPSGMTSVLGGIAFLRQKPTILGAISLDLFAVLLGSSIALLPIFATDILHSDPLGLGMLRAAPGIGALLISIIYARHPLTRHAGWWMFASVTIFGIATIAFGVSRSITFSVILLAITGGADVISVVIRSTLVQLGTPDAMRGRVSSVNALFIGSSNQLGEFESGMLAELLNPTAAVVLGGVGTLLITGLWIILFPSLRRLDRLEAITPETV